MEKKLQMNETETETGRILETLRRELSREEPGKIIVDVTVIHRK